MGLSEYNVRALEVFPPIILLEPYLDFFEFISKHDEDFEKEALIEEEKLLDDFYEHCIEHELEKTHLKNKKQVLKKIAIETIKKLHTLGFLGYYKNYIQEVDWKKIDDFYYLLKHIEKSDERKVKWAIYHFIKNRKSSTKFKFTDFENLVAELKISNLKKIVSKVMKTKKSAINAHLELLLNPNVPIPKYMLRSYVDDLEWTSRRSPGELEDDIKELLDQGSYSNKELVQILGTNKALISKAMNKLIDTNEIILSSHGTRGSHYYTTNCDNCPFGKDKFSCRRDAEKSIKQLIKSKFNVEISDKDLESIKTNQAVLKIQSILKETIKNQSPKLESNINENLNLILSRVVDNHIQGKIASKKPDQAYISLDEMLEKMPILYIIGFLHGSKRGASLMDVFIGQVLKDKIPKKMFAKLEKDFVKEYNKMASILK